jgi:hypothetical protein
MSRNKYKTFIFACLFCGRQIARRTTKSTTYQDQVNEHGRPITRVFLDAELDANGQPDWSKAHDCPVRIKREPQPPVVDDGWESLLGEEAQ